MEKEKGRSIKQQRRRKDVAEVGLKQKGGGSQGFKKEQQSALLLAAKDRDVHLAVNTEVTVNLGTVVSE